MTEWFTLLAIVLGIAVVCEAVIALGSAVFQRWRRRRKRPAAEAEAKDQPATAGGRRAQGRQPRGEDSQLYIVSGERRQRRPTEPPEDAA